ncbi:MAG: iron-containing redox enzyme family protein [Planctomycetes bacterium]|nr:iron-containing redox enzyme family protein [Planctomycetota bacterium]
MGFYERLNRATAGEQEDLFRIPFVAAALEGRIDRETYVAFLSQAYHHVKQTVPLLMATGARLPERNGWLRKAVAEYIREEIGHEEWILGDIAAPCEMMVAFAFDVATRGNPVGFFGMVQVLEGTSVRGATRAAKAIEASLGLPPEAFTYLTTHGDLDQDHVAFFRTLMDRVEDAGDQDAILHAARRFYRLYGDIFRSLLPEPAFAAGGVR